MRAPVAERAPVAAKASFAPKAKMGWRTRLGYAALSGLAGWALAQIATLPSNLLTALRDSEPHRVGQTLMLGALVWACWTLILALVAWLLIAAPLVLAVRPDLLVRLRRYIVWGALLAASGATLSKIRSFHDPAASTAFLRFFEVVPYGTFAVVYAVGTASVYIALAKRWLDRHGDAHPTSREGAQ
jgi:hypothetical protein